MGKEQFSRLISELEDLVNEAHLINENLENLKWEIYTQLQSLNRTLKLLFITLSLLLITNLAILVDLIFLLLGKKGG